MLVLLALTLAGLLINLLLQLAAIGAGVRVTRPTWNGTLGMTREIVLLGVVVSFLFLGHLLQIAVWAILFRLGGQFADWGTAFYHSTVNYASLGYGDIVMDEPWRLVGAIEASVGVMMFGVSTATIFAAMSKMFRQHSGRGGAGNPQDGS